jgi:MFS family permease
MSYLVSYATNEVGIARPVVLLGVFLAAVVAVVLYPVFGLLADRWGRKTTYLLGAVLMLVTVPPAFALINTGNAVVFAVALVLVFGTAMAPAGGVTGSLFSLVFSPEVRYSGASVGYTISQTCGAAFAPLIATALFAASGSSLPVVIYLLVVCAISVGSVLLLPGRLGQADPVAGPADGVGRNEAKVAAPAV